MSRAFIRSVSAAAVAGLLLAGNALPSAASTAAIQPVKVPTPDLTITIPASEIVSAMVGALGGSVAEAEAAGGWSVDFSGIGMLVLGPVLAMLTYEYEHGFFATGS